MKKYALPFAALAIVCFLLTPALWALGLAPLLGWLGVLFLMASASVVIADKRASKYDLGALRELHLEGGPPPDIDEIPEVADDAGVMCPCCHETYGSWLPACPHCLKRQTKLRPKR